jgi:hypothetical protein
MNPVVEKKRNRNNETSLELWVRIPRWTSAHTPVLLAVIGLIVGRLLF